MGTALLVATSALLTHLPAHAAPEIEARPVARGLDRPVAFTFDPDGRIWYVEKDSGEIRIFDPLARTDALFVRVPGVNGKGERGMLGIALHPRYPDRALVYVYVTRTAGGSLRNQILRYRDDDGSGAARRAIFSSPASGSPYHNGGRILFGPDRKLYAIVGDGHDASNSQDLSNDLGKILRLEPNGRIPRTNPFGDRLFAYGIRNSFGFAFDPETGRLWETENGPACNDEVNLIRKGRNYGWGPSARCEGASPGDTNRDGPRPVRPEDFYPSPIGITGIAFCDGCRLGRRSEGAAFWGAVNDGRVARAILNARRNGLVRRAVVYDHPSGTLSFETGPDGRLYFSDFGAIYVLRRASR